MEKRLPYLVHFARSSIKNLKKSLGTKMKIKSTYSASSAYKSLTPK